MGMGAEREEPSGWVGREGKGRREGGERADEGRRKGEEGWPGDGGWVVGWVVWLGVRVREDCANAGAGTGVRCEGGDEEGRDGNGNEGERVGRRAIPRSSSAFDTCAPRLSILTCPVSGLWQRRVLFAPSSRPRTPARLLHRVPKGRQDGPACAGQVGLVRAPFSSPSSSSAPWLLPTSSTPVSRPASPSLPPYTPPHPNQAWASDSAQMPRPCVRALTALRPRTHRRCRTNVRGQLRVVVRGPRPSLLGRARCWADTAALPCCILAPPISSPVHPISSLHSRTHAVPVSRLFYIRDVGTVSLRTCVRTYSVNKSIPR
ncbi:hypothetical protein C8F04DRAFT_1325533, partial [Mycena alexandri]